MTTCHCTEPVSGQTIPLGNLLLRVSALAIVRERGTDEGDITATVRFRAGVASVRRDLLRLSDADLLEHLDQFVDAFAALGRLGHSVLQDALLDNAYQDNPHGCLSTLLYQATTRVWDDVTGETWLRAMSRELSEHAALVA